MQFSFREEPYATHQPVLLESILRTKDSVIELGCGYFSTSLIHEAAKDRHVISLEHDKEWLSRFTHLSSDTKRFDHISTWDEIFSKINWNDLDISVIFVDQGDWKSRADCIDKLSFKSELLVLHDSDYLERELKVNFNDLFSYVKTWMPLQPYPYVTGPPTTVLSNFIDVTKWEINYADYV